MGALERHTRWRGPRAALGVWPTPVRRVQVAGRALWVKDEGAASPLYGGNKVRKLEFALGAARDALDAGGIVVTGGAAGSHHVVATALHAERLGLRVHAVLGPQTDGEDARHHLRITAARCERVRAATRVQDLPGLLADTGRCLGERASFLPLGGSNGAGTLGAADLGLELAEDVAAGRLPEPRRVVVAFGSGGSAVGLAAGLAHAGLESRVQAVAVSPRWFWSRRRLRRLAGALVAAWGVGAPSVEAILARLDVAAVPGDPGYSEPWAPAAAAVAAAGAAGLALETTYSGRAMAAVLDGSEAGPLAFVATANRAPLGPLLDATSAPPPHLASLLRGGA